MFTVPETRFHFGGDEYIYAEISREMTIESNFKTLATTDELRRLQIPGILDICPSNTSYLVRFNPEIILAYDLLDYLKEIDITKNNPAELNLSIRITEIPIWYDDPITREYSERFRRRHPTPELSDFEFAMKINGFTDKEAFIDAHTSMPFLITMMGFTPGSVWEFPLGILYEKIIRTPKYLSSRTDTPARAVGLGGGFSFVYSSSGPGSYQFIGMSAVPTVDQEQRLHDFQNSFFLARPGDLWKHRAIDESEYKRIQEEVQQGTYRFRIKEMNFSLEAYFRQKHSYISQLMEGF